MLEDRLKAVKVRLRVLSVSPATYVSPPPQPGTDAQVARLTAQGRLSAVLSDPRGST